jgi:hypothetical protein
MEYTCKFLFDIGKGKYICVLLNEYEITLYMWGHVLLHRMDQMLNDQKSTFVRDIYSTQQLIE